MKLEVGMYVRYKNGIGKINDYINNNYTQKFTYINNCGCAEFLEENQVIKASHNIVDLIEENDYIRIVTSAYFEPVYYSYGKLVIRDDIDINKYTNKFIAEVITHEQMKSMSYKVGE